MCVDFAERCSYPKVDCYSTRRHTGRKVPTSAAEKVFFSNPNQTSHNRNVHGEEKQFQCSNCDKKFATKTDMERHQTSSSNVTCAGVKTLQKIHGETQWFKRHICH